MSVRNGLGDGGKGKICRRFFVEAETPLDTFVCIQDLYTVDGEARSW